MIFEWFWRRKKFTFTISEFMCGSVWVTYEREESDIKKIWSKVLDREILALIWRTSVSSVNLGFHFDYGEIIKFNYLPLLLKLKYNSLFKVFKIRKSLNSTWIVFGKKTLRRKKKTKQFFTSCIESKQSLLMTKK